MAYSALGNLANGRRTSLISAHYHRVGLITLVAPRAPFDQGRGCATAPAAMLREAGEGERPPSSGAESLHHPPEGHPTWPSSALVLPFLAAACPEFAGKQSRNQRPDATACY